MNQNPFKKCSKAYDDFQTMSDLLWHCSKCELKSSQAKTWQVWKNEKGIQLWQDDNWNYYKIQLCENCWVKTYHRKIISTQILEAPKPRSWISNKVAKKVKDLYKNQEAFFLRYFSSNQLEVDHKFPQIRWNSIEDNNNDLSDEELRWKFILLSRSNNLWKSRQCEKCYKTGKRWNFPWIYFWWKWNDSWDNQIDKHDEKGCIGCFWHDPYKWRNELNNKINNS